MTNSVLRFLERRGEDLEPLYEKFDWPLHYLRDSSSWLEADRLEYILKTLEEIYGPRIQKETGQDFFEVIASAAPQLRAWGALDSVLRIVPGIKELYFQPDRFLASFISPQPSVRTIGTQTDETQRLEFEIDLPGNETPRAIRYLRSALEALPEFIGKSRSHVSWASSHVTIEWAERQAAFGPIESIASREAPVLSPELMRTVLNDLSESQRDLEATRRVLADRENELAKLKGLLAKQDHVASLSEGKDHPEARIKLALHEVFKLGDYFARAQQMITILRGPSGVVGGAKVNAEVMARKTAWDHVAQEAPEVIRKVAKLLQLEESIEEFIVDQKDSAFTSDKTKTALNKDLHSKNLHNKTIHDKRAPSFFDTLD